MYHRETTDAAIEKIAELSGWTPVRHTVAEVQANVSALDDLRDSETNALKRALYPDEIAFIENERMLCALDFRYCSSRYQQIVSWDKSSVRFEPNVAQNMVLDIWGQLEEQAMPISMQQLKARQLGVSTLTEMAVGHRVQFCPRVNAVVASSSPDKSVKMAKMIRYCWDNMPYWLMPTATRIDKGLPAEFGELNSSLLIQAGNQFTGIARGDTPNVVHLSELAEWVNPEDLVDSALLRAMHETPEMFLVLEGTGLGRGNWWHKTWKQAKTDWDQGRSRLCPLFLPWFVGTDIYPTKTWLRTRPIPAAWTPKDTTIGHAARARQYVLSNALLFKHLAKGNKDWRLPREQMWFYEVERDQSIKKNSLNLFLGEMPADDTEAFQSTNISAIDSQTILTFREATREPLGVYAVMGDGIPQSLVPSSRLWRQDLPQIHIPVNRLLRSAEVYHMIPLRFDGFSSTDPSLRLFIWEYPEDGEQYGFGVDTSDGIGQDSSVIEGVRRATMARCDAQVCEFASPYIKAHQLWPIALALGTFYSTYDHTIGKRKQARMAIECRGNGETVQLEMKKRGWNNFHPWLRYDHKRMPMASDATREGIYTIQWFRSQMLDMLLTMIEEFGIDIGSPWLVDEMEAIERDESVQSLKAVYGEHDDRFMALGFAIFSMHVLDRAGKQWARGRTMTNSNVKPVIAEHPVWTPNAQQTDSGMRSELSSRVSYRGSPARRLLNQRLSRGFR